MPRRVLQGVVVSDKSQATIIVRVERRFKHPVYKKVVRQSKRYHVHDPENAHSIGDIVRIRECRPVSKLKRWEVLPEAVA